MSQVTGRAHGNATDLPLLVFVCSFFFFCFFFLSSVFYVSYLSTRCCLFPSCFFPPPSPPVCLPLTLSLSILASDIIYIGPVKGKLLLFLCPLLFSTASSPSPRPPSPLFLTIHCPCPFLPQLILLRSHDICNLWDLQPSHLTASFQQRKSADLGGHMIEALPLIRN